MKKGILLVLGIVLLASTLWFRTGTASAAGSQVVLYLPGVTRAEVKNAWVSVDGNRIRNAYCVLKDKESGRVVCHVPGRYAGESIRIHIGGWGYVRTVPAPVGSNGGGDVSCEEPYVKVVDITLYYSSSDPRIHTFSMDFLTENWGSPEGWVKAILEVGYLSFDDYAIGDPYCLLDI